METEQQDLSLYCDDSYISLHLFAGNDPPTDDNVLMSDERYAEELQLQEAIMSSLLTPTNPNNFTSSSSSFKIKTEIGESSSSQTLNFPCEICVENKDSGDFVPIPNCRHMFCTCCISKHVSTRIQAGITGERVQCPGEDCKGFLELNACRVFLPPDVVSAWDDKLCESGSRKEEEMVHELAKKKKWKRCTRCNFYVEKTQGCLHIACRCGFEFCYSCGRAWSPSHVC